jgi:hypothetical protein
MAVKVSMTTMVCRTKWTKWKQEDHKSTTIWILKHASYPLKSMEQHPWPDTIVHKVKHLNMKTDISNYMDENIKSFSQLIIHKFP